MAPWPYSLPAYQHARAEVLRSGPLCVVCGRRRADTVDHHPWTVLDVRLGRAEPEVLWATWNLRPACRGCNSRLGARLGNRSRVRRRWDTGGQSRRW